MRYFWASIRILATSLRSSIISLSAAKSEMFSLFVEIFVSERRDFHLRGYHRLVAICHGEGSFPSGRSTCGAITPKDYRQLCGPSSFECVEASLQGHLDNLIDSLDLAIALGMVWSGEVFVDAELITKIPFYLIVELKGIVRNQGVRYPEPVDDVFVDELGQVLLRDG